MQARYFTSSVLKTLQGHPTGRAVRHFECAISQCAGYIAEPTSIRRAYLRVALPVQGENDG